MAAAKTRHASRNRRIRIAAEDTCTAGDLVSPVPPPILSLHTTIQIRPPCATAPGGNAHETSHRAGRGPAHAGLRAEQGNPHPDAGPHATGVRCGKDRSRGPGKELRTLDRHGAG